MLEQKGCQNLKDRELVPPPVMAHQDRWRLDQLLAWEERRMALAQAALEALVAFDPEEDSVVDLLPPAQATAARGMTPPLGSTPTRRRQVGSCCVGL